MTLDEAIQMKNTETEQTEQTKHEMWLNEERF